MLNINPFYVPVFLMHFVRIVNFFFSNTTKLRNYIYATRYFTSIELPSIETEYYRKINLKKPLNRNLHYMCYYRFTATLRNNNNNKYNNNNETATIGKQNLLQQ